MGSILTSTHEIQEQQAEKVTNHRRMGEEDGIVLLGVSKDQQHYIQHHIRIDPIKSRTTAKINNSTRFSTEIRSSADPLEAKERENPATKRI